MILDHISRAEKYYDVHPRFRAAFAALQAEGIRTKEAGEYELDGENLKLIIENADAGLSSLGTLEVHKDYIDIQYTIEGVFPLGWKADADCEQVQAEYDEAKDVKLYDDIPDFFLKLRAGNFAVLFPEDAHAPTPPEEFTKKAIIKVAVH